MAIVQLAGYDVATAEIVDPRYGIWAAEIVLVDAQALTKGMQVSLVAGDITLAGVVRSGGTYVARSSYTVVGGLADGWVQSVKARGYRNDGGVLLSQVAMDLSAEVGETVVLEPGVDRVLGPAWTRIAGPASTALRELLPSPAAWWIATDGTTHLGPRPAAPVDPSVEFRVQDFDPRRLRVWISSPDDTLAAFLPGAQWSPDGGATPFTTSGVIIHTSAGRVTLEAIG